MSNLEKRANEAENNENSNRNSENPDVEKVEVKRRIKSNLSPELGELIGDIVDLAYKQKEKGYKQGQNIDYEA